MLVGEGEAADAKARLIVRAGGRIVSEWEDGAAIAFVALADDGEARAHVVLGIQEQPGDYFTVVQVGQNAIAILGGIVGEGSLTPVFSQLLARVLPATQAASLGFALSFLVVTSAFILFSDLLPKRIGMNEPEKFAIRLVRPMQLVTLLLRHAEKRLGAGGLR